MLLGERSEDVKRKSCPHTEKEERVACQRFSPLMTHDLTVLQFTGNGMPSGSLQEENGHHHITLWTQGSPLPL